MFPFSNDDTDDEQTDTHTDDDAPETETKEVENTIGYTEHEGVATYADGTEEVFTFDKMERDDDAIVLADYTGVEEYKKGIYSEYVKPQVEKFATIPYANLRSFETVERRDRELMYTTMEEVDA